MMKNTLISVIADYGELHDLAFAEVTQRLYAELDPMDVTIKAYAVPAFDTVATGFALAQTALNSRLGERHKFYVNTAPRKDDLTPRVKNSGEGFAYARLKNGIDICAVNSGYSLSFIKDAAEEIRLIDCARDGSQFRSRDVFPPAFAQIAKGNTNALGDDIKNFIPDIPDHVLCYTDGYGNMKCSVEAKTLDSLKGRSIHVHANGCTQRVHVGDGIFDVADGEFCFSQGSSGWTLPNGQERRFVEIIKRGGSAAEAFANPPGGTKITWDG